MGKVLLANPRRIWYYNIKIDHKQIGCEGVHCIQVSQNRVQ
jgi:hypothetical protein